MTVHLVGVDPGLVHTGVVRMLFCPVEKEIFVHHEVIAGLNAKALQLWLHKYPSWQPKPIIYIEAYRPRSNLNSDKRMVEGVAAIKAVTKGAVLQNTGVKAVVKKDLMKVLGVWDFTTKTNHQDLRSAARIALLGMLKYADGNQLLSDIVRDYLDGSPWRVTN